MRRSSKIGKRLLILMSIICGLVFCLLKVFNDNISLFLKPAEVYEKHHTLKKEFRIGGYVKNLTFDKTAESYMFILTDNSGHEIYVNYKGMLPSLFREGQMSVVSGKLIQCEAICFHAREVLAKHDENYKPKV